MVLDVYEKRKYNFGFAYVVEVLTGTGTPSSA